ncbi:hypothetical protein D7V80_24225 [Corallococcus sp. CA054B]|nr:hypothetical protein D7V80_24225 [Corallococcus sp. CA054B]
MGGGADGARARADREAGAPGAAGLRAAAGRGGQAAAAAHLPGRHVRAGGRASSGRRRPAGHDHGHAEGSRTLGGKGTVGFLHRKFLGVVETPREAVLRNLGHLLQAKRGAASVLPGFGLTETGFRSDAERLAGLGAEIRETLSRYEPRVEVVAIDEVPAAAGGAPGLVVRLVLRDSHEPMDLLLDPGSRRLRERPPEEAAGEDDP